MFISLQLISTILEKLADKHEIYNKNKIYLCADKGYYTKKITRQMYINKGITLVVPKKNYNKKSKNLKKEN